MLGRDVSIGCYRGDGVRWSQAILGQLVDEDVDQGGAVGDDEFCSTGELGQRGTNQDLSALVADGGRCSRDGMGGKSVSKTQDLQAG